MKIRNGFVTNSSSSSFILAFKNENDLCEFNEYCHEYCYDEIKDLIYHFINNDKSKSKDEIKNEALNYVKNAMTWDDVSNWLDERTKDCSDWKERYEKEKELRETQEFKRFYDDLIHKDDVKTKLRRIRKSEIICQGTIWDSCGGLMEWAIRNGFLEDEFHRWVIIVQNVG